MLSSNFKSRIANHRVSWFRIAQTVFAYLKLYSLGMQKGSQVYIRHSIYGARSYAILVETKNIR